MQGGYDVAEDERLERLRAILHRLESALVAFSGGVDSTLLLKVAGDVLGDRVVAVTAESETCTAFELRDAETFCREQDIRHEVVHTDELSLPAFTENSPERCYHCKKERFGQLRQMADRLGLEYVIDGTNADDASDYRPGTRAAEELGVRSPLQEAGLGKADIRELSKQLGLPTWDRPSYACLASRIPYGTAITPEVLAMVGRAEEVLRELGFRQCRVRHHAPVARIELPPEEFEEAVEQTVRERIVARLKRIGYAYVTLDLQGYRTGSMNETLA